MKMTYPDVENGLGCRVTLWVSGCKHHCKGCHNEETWDFLSGKEFTSEDKEKLFGVLSKPYIKGITFSGGDPIFSYDDVVSLCEEIRERFPSKNIWLYSGFTIEEIRDMFPRILGLIDVLVDGRFVESLRDVSLAFRGSSNQRIWRRDAESGEFSIYDLDKNRKQ